MEERQGASITIDYPDSNVLSFQLKSLYFAWDQGVPQDQANITISGTSVTTDRKSITVTKAVSQMVTYPPLLPPIPTDSINMKKAAFGSEWKDLHKVTFEVAGDMAQFGGLVLDQVVYQVLKCPS